MIVLGILAFLLFVLGDVNDAYIKKRALKHCFAVGLLMLATATICRFGFWNKSKIVWIALGAIFLSYLLRALFGSFSNKEAYSETPKNREVDNTGLYTMCRHPGVLFFAGLYLCLHFGIGLPWLDTLLYIGLNLALATLEDKYFFPEFLEGYEKYRDEVPFLIPTKDSIKNSMKKTDRG